jgi:uncharacterized membrane protein YfcA
VSQEPRGLSRFLGPVVWIGLAGGIGSGLFGVGGGVILVPLLVRFLGLTQQAAHGTALAVALFTAPAALVQYARTGHVNVPWSATLALGSVIGAPLGARWAHETSEKNLRRAFGALLLILAVRLSLTHLPEGNVMPESGVWAFVARVALGWGIGVASGYFGVGGGVILVPTLVLLAGLKQVEAQGISLLFVIPTAASGTWTHRKLGNVKMNQVLPLAVWSILGAFASATVATHLSGHTLRAAFAVFLFSVGAKLTFTGATRAPQPA